MNGRCAVVLSRCVVPLDVALCCAPYVVLCQASESG